MRPRARLARAATLFAACAFIAGCTGNAGLAPDDAAASAPAASAPAASAPAASAPAASTSTASQRRSGRDDMSPALQALQDDLARNPGTLWVEDGKAHWNRPAGPLARSCASCHQDAAVTMADAATRYPAWDNAESRALSLGLRIERCRSRHQQVPASALDADTGLALQAWLTNVARGKPIAPPADERMRAVRAEGERLYRQRMGQLDLSCAQCHDERAGLRLAGALIPQGHPNGYPLYRLQWQAMGDLERRLRNCTTGVRAQPWPPGDAAWVALEAYLMQRAAGMAIESPAVRP